MSVCLPALIVLIRIITHQSSLGFSLGFLLVTDHGHKIELHLFCKSPPTRSTLSTWAFSCCGVSPLSPSLLLLLHLRLATTD